MNGPGRIRRHSFFLLLAPLLFASIAIPAARSDAAEAGVSPAQVAEGLKTIQIIAGDVAESAGTNKAKAELIAEGIEPVWSKVEDTIKAKDKDAYVAFEEGIETLAVAAKAGDAKQASAAADAVNSAVKAYVAKFPAGDSADRAAASATPAPAPPARAADDAAPAPGEAPEAAEAGDPTLARTGGTASALTALAGAAFGLGGLAVMAGARRRRVSPIV